MPKNQFIKFDQWEKTIEKKFVVYADFESILPPDEKYHQKHEPIAAGAVFLREGSVIEKFENFGPNCVRQFLEWIEKKTEEVYKWYDENAHHPMVNLTPIQEILFPTSTVCYLCKEKFTDSNIKVIFINTKLYYYTL